MQRAYRITAIDQLLAELLRSTGAEERLRQIEQIEQVIAGLKPADAIVVGRVIQQLGCRGWVRPDRSQASGTDLIHDLRLLVEDLSDSIDLPAEAVGEQVLTVEDLARQFCVSTKTISRWREAGLVSRRLVFDGRKRVGFLRSSVDRFVRDNQSRVARGGRFSQLTTEQRNELVADARRLASDGIERHEVTNRLASRMGRTTETVRTVFRQHDLEHPSRPVFPSQGASLTVAQRLRLFEAYQEGASVEKLASRHNRSKTTIYRVIQEMRVDRILEMQLEFMPNDRFSRKGAEGACLAPVPEPETTPRKARRPEGLPAYLASLYEVPLLTREQEAHLFRRYNYLKYKASKLRDQLDLAHPKAALLEEIERLHRLAVATKNDLSRANLRLVVSIAKKRMTPGHSFFELVSDGNISLFKAIEKFDFARGNKFSTYATWAIVKNFARSIPSEYKHQDRFRTSHDELFESAEEHRANPTLDEAHQKDRERSIRKILRRLDEREQQIVISRFGLDHSREPLTLKELGAQMGVTKERVRQIEVRALNKLRLAAAEEHVQIE